MILLECTAALRIVYVSIGFSQEIIGFSQEIIGFSQEIIGFSQEIIGFSQEIDDEQESKRCFPHGQDATRERVVCVCPAIGNPRRFSLHILLPQMTAKRRKKPNPPRQT